MEFKDFETRRDKYIISVENANSEANKAYYFLEFIRDVFKDAELNAGTPKELQMEKYIKSSKTILIKGRIDARLGNLIIEFKDEITSAPRLQDAIDKIKKYTAILWNTEGIIQYLCVATDGITFLIYRPRSNKTNFIAHPGAIGPLVKFTRTTRS